MTNLMVDARGIRKSFGTNEVLKGIDFQVPKGKVVCLLGASGSGKSTFLRCINHLETINGGVLYVDGSPVGFQEKDGKLYELREKEIAKQRADVGMVFQRFNLFEHRTALENVIEAPILIRKMDRKAAIEKAQELLYRVGLGDKSHAYPKHLSGGQQQRVAIARALAMNPKLMLFDEATSALDPELVGEVLDVMKGLADAGMTMIVVTHEINFAREVADEVVFMARGVVEEKGPPREVLLNPQSPITQSFLSKVL